MAYFGRTPKKPGSVPGAASGFQAENAKARLSGIGRELSRGRQQRPGRANRALRANRTGRKAR